MQRAMAAVLCTDEGMWREENSRKAGTAGLQAYSSQQVLLQHMQPGMAASGAIGAPAPAPPPTLQPTRACKASTSWK